MAGYSTSMVKFMNPHPLKINVVKFDGKNNFGMWRCEVMDALTASNLEDTLRLEKKPEATFEEDWNKMNQMACGMIRSCLTQHRVAFAIEEEALSLSDEERNLH